MIHDGTWPVEGLLAFPTRSPSFVLSLWLSLQLQASSRSSQSFLI